MGACPKNKVSRLRARNRRAHIKVAPVTLSECLHCRKPKQAHRVCPNCGYYDKDVKVLNVAAE